MNHNKIKVMLFDTGIHQQVMKLAISKFIAASDFSAINRGCLAEVLQRKDQEDSGSFSEIVPEHLII